jgi:hypothetical protein
VRKAARPPPARETAGRGFATQPRHHITEFLLYCLAPPILSTAARVAHHRQDIVVASLIDTALWKAAAGGGGVLGDGIDRTGDGGGGAVPALISPQRANITKLPALLLRRR